MKKSYIRKITINNESYSILTVKRASKYIVLTGDDLTDFNSIRILDILRNSIVKGTSNDIAKYNLPECYKTELTWSINARSLKNFLSLRTDKSALKEIRKLAFDIYDNLPDTHKFLFKGDVKEKYRGE